MEVTKALSGFGEIRQIKSEVYSYIYIGVRHVLMEIKQPIPFCMLITGHWWWKMGAHMFHSLVFARVPLFHSLMFALSVGGIR